MLTPLQELCIGLALGIPDTTNCIAIVQQVNVRVEITRRGCELDAVLQCRKALLPACVVVAEEVEYVCNVLSSVDGRIDMVAIT